MKLLRSSAIIGFFTLLSRLLGLLRDVLMARFLGVGYVSDALFTAFKLPNLFRRIFAEGAFNAAFVPLYARRIEEEGEEAASQFASEAFAALFVIVAALVVVFELTMPIAMNLLGTGLSREVQSGGALTEQLSGAGQVLGLSALPAFDLAVLYAQITMPYLIFMSLGALFCGMLNTRHYFAVAAAAPIMLNIALVGVLGTASAATWSRAQLGLYLSIAMLIAGALQIGLVIWGLRRAGIKIGLQRPRLTPGVKRLFALGLPGAIAAGITQINLMVSHNIATTLQGAASWLNYADRLYQLPLGMIGIAIGVALLPSLSRAIRAGNEDGAADSFNRALEISLALTLPAAIALAVIPHFLVSGLFESGAFSAADTAQTALALRMFAFGLPAFVLIKVLTPAFFARENTHTPMYYAGASAIINASLGALLFFTIGFYGLALATTIAAWVNVALLARRLSQQNDFALDERLRARLPRLFIASLIMGVAVNYIGAYFSPMIGGAILRDIALLLLVCGSGAAFYFAACFALGALRLSELKAAFRKSA